MTQVKRSWDLLTDQERKTAVSEIVDYFASERNEKIGLIAAENLLDKFLHSSAVNIYNKGIEDAKSLVNSRIEDLNIELETQKKDR